MLGRVFAFSLLLGVLGAGWYASGRSGRNSKKRVQDMQGAVAQVEEVEVGVLAKRAEFDTGRFTAALAEDAEAFELPVPKVTAMADVQTHNVEVEDPMVLRAGGKWSNQRVSLAATIEKVNYQQHGATVSAPHRVVTLGNKSKQPLAYKLRVGAPGTEKCQVRGSRMHNAMALRPGETAEVVVCAGRGRVRIEHLETLTITELGYHYLSQLPPTAVGYDTVTAHAHRPLVRIKRCDDTDPTAILRMLGTGSLRWVDVADFYSRHNCHRFELFEAYRHTSKPLERLPALPPDLVPSDAASGG
ncbi:MAG: hypothetical protein AAF721_19420 [Myxococcota bacterium]